MALPPLLLLITCNALMGSSMLVPSVLRATCTAPRVSAQVQCGRKARRRRQAAQQAAAAEPDDQLEEPQLVCDENGCRLGDVPIEAADAGNALQMLTAPRSPETGNRLLATPAAYDQLLQVAAPDKVNVIRYGAPWCRSCRTIGPSLQEFIIDRWPSASVYELSLVRNGKAAGERMYRCAQHPFSPFPSCLIVC
jgi:hypothetical protein